MIAGIDSMVPIFAGIVPSKNSASTIGQLQVYARILLHQLRNDTIILPSISVAEILVPVPKKQQGLLIAKLTKLFVCPQFDMRAASIAAALWADHKKVPANLQYKNRHVLRSDTMIVATAKASGATQFYSHDKKCRALASLAMEAHDLPKSDSTDMFLKGDIERGEF
jgi:predicted nucleic acid-binding protein